MAAAVPVALPLRKRRPRKNYSTGMSRDLHGMSLRQTRLAKRWLKAIALQMQIAAANPSDDEAFFMLHDMFSMSENKTD